jgi:hypothetical protein
MYVCMYVMVRAMTDMEVVCTFLKEWLCRYCALGYICDRMVVLFFGVMNKCMKKKTTCEQLTPVCVYVCMYVCAYVCEQLTPVCMYVCMNVCMCVCMVGVCMFFMMLVCMLTCMYVCMYVCYDHSHDWP